MASNRKGSEKSETLFDFEIMKSPLLHFSHLKIKKSS